MCLCFHNLLPYGNNIYRYFSVCLSLPGCVVYTVHVTNCGAMMPHDHGATFYDLECITVYFIVKMLQYLILIVDVRFCTGAYVTAAR